MAIRETVPVAPVLSMRTLLIVAAIYDNIGLVMRWTSGDASSALCDDLDCHSNSNSLGYD